MDTRFEVDVVEKSISKQNNKEVVTSKELQEQLIQHHGKLLYNKNYIKGGVKTGVKAIEKIEKVLNKNIINVDLEIPKEFLKKISESKIYRKSGSLKTVGTEKYAKHLNEIKPSNAKKITKIANLAFIAFDIVESIVLDEKLKEILIYVKEIDLKLDAQNKGRLKSAITQMKDLNSLTNNKFKMQKISSLISEFSYCEHLYDEMYSKKIQRCEKVLSDFNASNITNHDELTEFTKIGETLANDLEPIVLCKVAIINLYEQQEEFVLAKEKSFDLNMFTAKKVDEFKGYFGKDALSDMKNNYVRYATQNRKGRFADIEDAVIESDEKIEFIFNSSICKTLSIPEEKEEVEHYEIEKRTYFARLKNWLLTSIRKIIELTKSKRVIKR